MKPNRFQDILAVELGVQAKVPEWNNMTIQMALEQDASFTARGVSFLDGRQTRIILIK